MERDLIYVFDKTTKVGINFGEVQSGFNMSFVIDGTKDSCQLVYAADFLRSGFKSLQAEYPEYISVQFNIRD